MNYINNASAGLCCGLGEADRLEIEETAVLVDCETGEDMAPFPYRLVPGRTYRCEKRWALKQSYNLIKAFKTREEAKKAYDDLVNELLFHNVVIKI